MLATLFCHSVLCGLRPQHVCSRSVNPQTLVSEGAASAMSHLGEDLWP